MNQELGLVESSEREALPVSQSERQTRAEMLNGALVQCMSRGNLEEFRQFMSMVKEIEENESRAEFNKAFAAFSANAPKIIKTAWNGHKKQKYADLNDVSRALKPKLAEFGLSYYWTTDQQPGSVTVTCHLVHESGYSVQTSMTGPEDKGAGRNEIQSVGSSRSYLARYTLQSITGMPTGEDDDGESAGAVLVTEEQALELDALAKKNGHDMRRFCDYMGVESLCQIRQSSFLEARNTLSQPAPKV